MPTFGMFDSLAEYPHWFVVTCAAVAAAAVLWLLLKLLKVALWLLFVGVVVAAGLTAIWLLLR
jgi:hypothetical protein